MFLKFFDFLLGFDILKNLVIWILTYSIVELLHIAVVQQDFAEKGNWIVGLVEIGFL